MRYQPLDSTKNEIRILEFLDPSSLISTEEPVRCSIRNVPLQERSFYSRSDQDRLPNQKCPKAWDRFTKCVDLRDATLEQTTIDKETTVGLSQGRDQLGSSRYDWGDFEALSYTWGSQRNVKSIIVNEMQKDVSENLEAALRALRNLQETRLGMLYWIDSLCINQEDEKERNAQVKRMRDIYSRARAVIVWLGEDGDTDGIAVCTMRHLCWNPCPGDPPQLPEDLLVNGRPALSAFAHKPYWNRAWIIQELAMNHNSTLILCGKYKLTRRMLRLGARCCRISIQVSEDQSYRSDQGLDLGPVAWSKADRMRRLVNPTSNSDFAGTLSSLLDLVRQAKATDEKDKVYSILGLLDPAISADVVPDYSLSVQQVYTDFMKAVIKHTESLDQILYGGIPTETRQLWPSWVPDPRLPFARNHNQYLETRRASGGLAASFQFCNRGKQSILVCDGFQVDVVDGITAKPLSRRHFSPQQHSTNRYSSSLSKALEQTLVMGHPGATKGLLLDIPWRPSCEASTSHSQPNFAMPQLCQSRHFEQLDHFRKLNQDFRIGGTRLKDFFPESSTKSLDIKTTLSCMRLAMLSLDERALVTTETGYLGLAPIAVRRGDVVAILLGCKCPVVLRPYCGDMYQVVGECYVHGLMDGEILAQERDGRVSRSEFVLC